MLRLLLSFYLVIFSSQSYAFQKTPTIKVNSAWNKPTLVQDNDNACKSVLKDAQLKFYSDTDWGAAYGVRGHGYSTTGTILDWQVLGSNSLEKIHAYDKDFYLYNHRHSGCGGACERNQSLISEIPFQKPSWSELNKMAETAPPAMSYGYTYAQSNNNIPYMFVLGQYQTYKNKLFVYRLSPEATWKSACEISLTAPDIPFNKGHSYFSAQKSINNLYSSTLSLSQGGGSTCGSMDTIWRWRNRISQQLNMTLVRPWALKLKGHGGINSYGDYSQIIKQLEEWSLTGISEKKAFSAYKTQLEITKRKLSSFYQNANHWTVLQSDEMAEFSLTSAVARGFGFYSFNTGFSAGELDLRRAIVNNESLLAIKKIPFDAQQMDKNPSQYASPVARESILNLAILRPEVLKYLLTKGINPNKRNDFGKTPLMYAAQYNLLDSAKLLIEYGANISASTLKPSDTCFYNLKTFKMTALHYAVRYASPDFIELLLDNGAPLYLQADNQRIAPRGKETPLVWLQRYTDEDSKEINSNIPPEDIVGLKMLLTPPSPENLQQLESQLIKSALKYYQQGHKQKAYEHLSNALHINPRNEKAISDMSLIALKNQKLGHSLAMSNSLIKNSKNSKTVANAWFNQGLVCEQHYIQRKKNNIGFTIQYDGQYYCSQPYIYSYLSAWTSSKSKSRKNKILSLFNHDNPESCSILLEGSSLFKFYFSQNKILFLRPKGDLIPLDLLFEQVKFSSVLRLNNPIKKNIPLNVTNTYDLSDYIIKEIESPFGYYRIENNGELTCSHNL